MCTAGCVCTNDKLLCVRDVVVETVINHAVIEIVPARRSDVITTKVVFVTSRCQTYHVDLEVQCLTSWREYSLQ